MNLKICYIYNNNFLTFVPWGINFTYTIKWNVCSCLLYSTNHLLVKKLLRFDLLFCYSNVFSTWWNKLLTFNTLVHLMCHITCNRQYRTCIKKCINSHLTPHNHKQLLYPHPHWSSKEALGSKNSPDSTHNSCIHTICCSYIMSKTMCRQSTNRYPHF